MMASALQKATDSTSTLKPPPASAKGLDTSPFHFTGSACSSYETPSPPFIHVEGVPNFRDLGSYPCQPPAYHSSPNKSYITRPFTLFRSAQLTGMTPNGAITLSKRLKVRRLYDLRSEREITKGTKDTKLAQINGVVRVFVPVFRDQDYSPEGLARKYKNYTDPDEDEGHGYSTGFIRAYRDIFLNAGPAYKTILEHIRDCDIHDDDLGASRPEPLLFHCAAGKDRTSVFGALVLKLCGVPHEIIAWEYSITEHGLGAWREEIIAHFMKGGEDGSGTPAMTREEAERAVGSRANNMLVFLNEVVDGEWGGVEKYMQDHCGLSAEDIELVRQRLIVEGESLFGDGTGYWKQLQRTGEEAKGLLPPGRAEDDADKNETSR
jgi:protein tyrosine/serine phosphatase